MKNSPDGLVFGYMSLMVMVMIPRMVNTIPTTLFNFLISQRFANRADTQAPNKQ